MQAARTVLLVANCGEFLNLQISGRLIRRWYQPVLRQGGVPQDYKHLSPATLSRATVPAWGLLTEETKKQAEAGEKGSDLSNNDSSRGRSRLWVQLYTIL